MRLTLDRTNRRGGACLPRLAIGVFLLCGLLVAPARAQRIDRLNHQAWSTEDGLPQNSVHQIFQSHDGYLWLATEGGVARFDGVSFRLFSHETEPALLSDDVCCLAEDGSRAMWFGTADGLVRWDGRVATRVAGRETLGAIESLVAAEDGAVLALTAGGLFRVGSEGVARVPVVGSPVLAISAGADGSVWLASAAGLDREIHGQKSRTDLPQSVGAGAVDAGAVDALVVAPDGSFGLRTRDSVVLVRNGVVRRFAAGRELPGNRVQALFVDRSGVAWVGTNRGLVTIDPVGATVAAVPALGQNSILCAFQDREGNHWIGTETSGLHVLRERKFWGVVGLGDEVVTAVVEARDGSMWVGTRDDGLREVRGGEVERPKFGAATSSIVLSLAPGVGGDVWVGTPDGLNHIDGAAVRTYSSATGLPDDFVRSLLVDPDGSVWVGTRRGLAHLQGSRVSTLTRADGLGSDLIGTLYREEPGGALWIGTLGGLSELQAGKLKTFGARDGLLGEIVTAVTRDGAGGVWVGTRDGGLSRVKGDRVTAFRASGLPRSIDALATDREGFLWIRGKEGIARVRSADLSLCAAKGDCSAAVRVYGAGDGMPSAEAAANGHPAVWSAANGELWFTTRKGVAITDPAHFPVNAVPPLVVLERWTVDDRETSTGPGELRVAPGHVRYTFDYAGLSYTAPSEVRYRFLLEGLDRKWTDAGGRRSATYTNLPPGKYRFRVQAANNDGVWNEAGAELSFVVAPPFYRRWWFYVLAALSVGLLGTLLYRLRLRRLQTEFNLVLAERNRLAREIHDTLAQDFVGVSLQLEIISQLLKHSAVEAAAQQVDQTRKLVTEGLADARRSIWELRANTATDSLPTRLTEVADRFGREAGVRPRLLIGGAYRPLSTRIEDETIRIAQEALTNVARHAGATEVAVELRYSDDSVLLELTDNGRGFPTTTVAGAAEGHYGLHGMQERAAVMGARLVVKSEPGKGTTVTLTVPIAPAAVRERL